MDHESSGHLDTSDPVGVRLFVLGYLCRDGNGYAAWAAYRLCQEKSRNWPEWLVAYFHEVARFLLDEYQRSEKRDRQIEAVLRLGSPKAARLALTTTDAAKLAQWQNFTKSILPGLIDDHAKAIGVPTQTAIKHLAPTLGFEGDQWTQLRDAYDRAVGKKKVRSPMPLGSR
jgi:hypothetical protein